MGIRKLKKKIEIECLNVVADRRTKMFLKRLIEIIRVESMFRHPQCVATGLFDVVIGVLCCD